MKNKTILLLIIFCISLFCCKLDKRLKVLNNSKNTIFVLYDFDSVLITKIFEKDYIYEVNKHNDTLWSFHSFIKPGKIYSFGIKENWKSAIVHSPNKKIDILVIDIDFLKKYFNGDLQAKEKIITKTYSLSVEDLNKINWVVVFEEE